jgi:hypothetical protein
MNALLQLLWLCGFLCGASAGIGIYHAILSRKAESTEAPKE